MKTVMALGFATVIIWGMFKPTIPGIGALMAV